LFASDCPWASSAETFTYLDSLPIRDDVKEKIYYANAEKLLKIRAQSKASV
ncbi:MAG: amidohydrolase family protein, partial [Clostridia bacterium]|nr:amidohydrolase family protein [Clostridia bacterium]